MKLILFIGGLISLSALSCAACKETPAPDTPLYDTKWSLKKIHSKDSIQNIQTKAFIKFNKEKGSAGGNGSCNSFGSSATVSGDHINFKNIFSTKMYCEAVQQVENNFLGRLDKVNRYEIIDKSLFLYRDKELLFEFAAAEDQQSSE